MNIDRIAREMVDVEPSADLEARIRARVRATPADRPAAWWTWRVAMPVAAAAAVVIAVVVPGPGLARRSAEREGGSQVQSTEAAVQGLPAETQSAEGLPTETPSAKVRSSIAQVPTSPATQVSKVRKVQTVQLSAEEVAWMERRIPALDSVTGLQMDQLRVDSIQPEPLAITPLTMTPVSTEGAGSERRIDR